MFSVPLDKDYEKRLKLCRTYNTINALLKNDQCMTTVFCGEDGIYYDSIGDEFFIATRIGVGEFEGMPVPLYAFEYSDETQQGMLKVNGLIEYLGEE